MIINNDCLDEMRKMEANSVSCIVTDPPYGLGFMGKKWDMDLPHDEIWKEALRIVKPGGHLLSFGGTRTYHRLTCAIEDSGWEIRDCLMWVFGSGFPKSHNHFGIPGFGTALKPAYEPILLCMKPCDGTFKQNAETWGQAGINIDGCRIDANWDTDPSKRGLGYGWAKKEGTADTCFEGLGPRKEYDITKGRWPANILFDEEAAALLDEQSGESKSSGGDGYKNSIFCGGKKTGGHGLGDSGGASRFFYCAKTSSRERNEGLEGMPDIPCGGLQGRNDGSLGNQVIGKNHHPTVKPLKLMRYLITLVMPPKDGVLLDPFAGSGSTIVAAHQLGLKAIGIEKSADYCEIARKRIDNASVIKKEENPQMDFLDGTNQ